MSLLGPFLSFMSELLLVFVFMIFILGGRGRLEKKIALAFSPDQPRRWRRRCATSTTRCKGIWSFKPSCAPHGSPNDRCPRLVHLPFAIVFGVLTSSSTTSRRSGPSSPRPCLSCWPRSSSAVLPGRGDSGPSDGDQFHPGEVRPAPPHGKGTGPSSLLGFFSLFLGFGSGGYRA